MPKFTQSDIVHVAKLAKLQLNNQELLKYTKELTNIVDYVSQLNEVDTGGTEPTSQTTGLTNVKRADEVKTEACLSQEEALSGTDKTHNGYFVVPGILKKV
ncbi:Asp-tRNA(Asn)/Glu-tRNA(Gln) amidotransferase subunit GatC [Candidatus Woesebacteria bacterium]|nr:Asp-tRNA(Asn)/Glu-tRNA(Gln) amidotransferase subunit GatC [Candidatus Woesebacteria bacterium]